MSNFGVQDSNEEVKEVSKEGKENSKSDKKVSLSLGRNRKELGLNTFVNLCNLIIWEPSFSRFTYIGWVKTVVEDQSRVRASTS